MSAAFSTSRRRFLLAAGLEQLVEYLETLRFESDHLHLFDAETEHRIEI